MPRIESSVTVNAPIEDAFALSMVSEYTSFRPPTQVGMKLLEGPPFFATFGGG